MAEMFRAPDAYELLGSRYACLPKDMRTFLDTWIDTGSVSKSLVAAGYDARNTAVAHAFFQDLDFTLAAKERAQEISKKIPSTVMDKVEAEIILASIAREDENNETRIKAILAMEKIRNPRVNITNNNFNLKELLDSVEKGTSSQMGTHKDWIDR